MSGTVIAAVKAALVGANSVIRAAALPALAGVKISYDVPRDLPLEYICAGRAGGPLERAAMKAGTRVKRQEDLSVQLIYRVNMKNQQDTEATDARVTAMAAAVDEWLAANRALGGSVDGVKAAWAGAHELDGFVDDDGATSIMTQTIGITSFLT